MNKYRNKMTGHVIKTTGQVQGGSWELIQNMPPQDTPPTDTTVTQSEASKNSQKRAKTQSRK